MSFNEYDSEENQSLNNSYSPEQLVQNRKRSKKKHQKFQHQRSLQLESKILNTYDQLVEESANQNAENNYQQQQNQFCEQFGSNDNQTTAKTRSKLSSKKVQNDLQAQTVQSKGCKVSNSKNNELTYYPGQSKNVFKNLANVFAQETFDLQKQNPEKFDLPIWKKFFTIYQKINKQNYKKYIIKNQKKNLMNKQLLFAVLTTDVGKQIGTKFFANFQWARIFLYNNSTDVKKYLPFRLYKNKKDLVKQENLELLNL